VDATAQAVCGKTQIAFIYNGIINSNPIRPSRNTSNLLFKIAQRGQIASPHHRVFIGVPFCSVQEFDLPARCRKHLDGRRLEFAIQTWFLNGQSVDWERQC